MKEIARKELLTRWLEDHAGLIHKVVRAFARDEEDRNDLFQDIALQLWRSTAAFRSDGAKASTWIYKVALNTAIVYRRKTGASRDARPIHDGYDAAASEEHSTADPVEKREMLDLLYEAIRALGEADRSVILLHLEGLSNGEISEVLGISNGYVAVKLTRVRKRLSESLRRFRDGA